MSQEQTSHTRPDTPSDDSDNQDREVYIRYIPRNSVKKMKLMPEPAGTVDCTACGQWAAHHELFGNPCCKKKSYCLECFLGQYKKKVGAKFHIPSVINCKKCLHIFPNPLAPDSDLESLIKINQVVTLPVKTTDQIWNYIK